MASVLVQLPLCVGPVSPFQARGLLATLSSNNCTFTSVRSGKNPALTHVALMRGREEVGHVPLPVAGKEVFPLGVDPFGLLPTGSYKVPYELLYALKTAVEHGSVSLGAVVHVRALHSKEVMQSVAAAEMPAKPSPLVTTAKKSVKSQSKRGRGRFSTPATQPKSSPQVITLFDSDDDGDSVPASSPSAASAFGANSSSDRSSEIETLAAGSSGGIVSPAHAGANISSSASDSGDDGGRLFAHLVTVTVLLQLHNVDVEDGSEQTLDWHIMNKGQGGRLLQLVLRQQREAL